MREPNERRECNNHEIENANRDNVVNENRQLNQGQLDENEGAVGGVEPQQPVQQVQQPLRIGLPRDPLIQMQYQKAAAAELRLERITAPVFSGEYSHWVEWTAMNDSLVHLNNALANTQKFHYLKKSVTGQAERMLSGWHATGENYQ